MKLEDLLRHLGQPGVTEVAFQGGRLPCACIDGKFRPIADDALSTEDLGKLIVAIGGARSPGEIGAQPHRWQVQSKSVGLVEAIAQHKGELQLRFRRPPRRSQPPRTLKAKSTTRPPPRPPPQRAVPDLELPATIPPLFGGGAPKEPALELQEPRGSRPRRELVLDVPDPRSMPSLDLAAPSPGERSIELATSPSGTRQFELGTSATGAAQRTASAPGAREDALDELLATARKAKASDLHLMSLRPALLRIASDLQPVGPPIDGDALEAMLLSRIPERSRPELERRGACAFSLDQGAAGRCRVIVSKQRTGLKAGIRLIPAVPPTLAGLGLPEKLGLIARDRSGFVLVSAPPCHGKTATVAAIVDAINREAPRHVVVVEDPLEFVHPRRRALVTHREVGTHTKSLGSGLRGALREDPDVVVMGELHDVEAARLALFATEKGLLVIATIDAASAPHALERLVRLFPASEQPHARHVLGNHLHTVTCQRLLPNPQHTALSPAVEVLPASDALCKLVRDGLFHEIPAMQQRGKALGLVRLDESLAELVRSGRTDLEAARAHALAPDTFGASGPRAPQLAPKLQLKKGPG